MRTLALKEGIMSKNIGLVLEGGGVKGAYELGALIALTEKGYTFSAVTGTSIGALNGAVMASQGIEKLAAYWEEAKYCPVFDFDDDTVARFRQKDFDLDLIIATGKKLLSAREIIRQSYEHTLDFVYNRLSEEEIRSSDIDFGCVTYNISDMEPFEAMKKDIPEGKLIDYIVASACFPIFPPKQIDGKKFIDGGVYDNMPINLLARTGCKKMVVVRTNPESKQPKRRIERDDLDILYIIPSSNLGRAMAFSPERIENLKQLGYADAMRILTEAESAAADSASE
mgnify:FL=1